MKTRKMWTTDNFKTHYKVVVPNGDWSKEYVLNEKCDGKVYYDEALEGKVCTKCGLYTGIK